MIDGYCHCGLSKFLPVEDVDAMLKAVGIERAVLVQHFGEVDNSYLARVVDADRRRFRAVALFDHTDPDWRRLLSEAAASAHFTGIRLSRETILERLELCTAAAELGFVLMVDASPRGLREIVAPLRTLVEHESAGVVVSHLGYPRIVGDELVAGRELLDFAGSPSTYVLLSGTTMWPPASSRALDRFTSEVIDAFGPQRLIWGSNYPPCGGIDGVRDDVERITSERWGFTPDELASVTHGNAARLWFT